jgi:electron transport complex protein RnfB
VTLARAIDALLPQTQCTRCGYPTCQAYADAIAGDQAGINRCPPGGAAGIEALAALLGRATQPLDPACGSEAPPTVAQVDEDACIGCTKCIQACPVDAIVGAARRMHTVLADECTGCGLCLPPCPVDCIALLPAAAAPLAREVVLARAAAARARHVARGKRLANPVAEPRTRRTAAPESLPAPSASAGAPAPISRSAVLEAIARGKARRAARSGAPTQ